MAGSGAPWQFGLEMVDQRCGYLLSSGQLSDCTFVVGSGSKQKVVLAHKLILAMASPIFEVMLYGEPSDLVLSIPDAKPEAFQVLLQYIYTGNLNLDSFDMAFDLWHVAEKYKLPHLVKECSGYIGSVVCPSNVCRAHAVAQVFDDGTLIDKCLKIISKNTNEVLNHSSFEEVEMKTLITVCSLEHLNVDSDLDLFNAVARYAEAEQWRQEQTLSESLSALRLEPLPSGEQVLLHVESSSGTSPAVELHSTPPTDVVASEPTANKENFKEEEPSIRAALQKLRFLSLTPAQFAEGPASSDLLTEAERFAVLMNIASRDSPVPMPAGFSECREPRQPHFDSDDEGSNAKPRTMLRTDFGIVVSSASMKKADHIVRGLSSGDLAICEAAARAARRLLSKDTETSSQVAAQLVAAGGIPPLLAALSHSGPSVQFDAACALTNIACVVAHALALVQGGAVPVLVSLLRRGGGALAAQAAWALGNIAGGQRPACDAVVGAGALPALLALMQPGVPAAQLGSYVRAYRIICQNSRLSGVRLDLSPAMAYITNLLVLDDEQVLTESCWVLYHLMDEDQITDSSLIPTALMVSLAALLRPAAAPQPAVAALAALGNLLRIYDMNKQIYLAVDSYEHIINALKSENPSIVKYAAWAAANILVNCTNSEQALQKRILDPLGQLLIHGDPECKSIAVRALTNLCAQGSPAQLGVLMTAAALQPYCRLLAESSTRHEVLRGLTNLLKYHCILALWMKLRELGVPELLETLKDDPWYREDAAALLTRYFSSDQFKPPAPSAPSAPSASGSIDFLKPLSPLKPFF